MTITELWNEMAGEYGLPKVIAMTPKRKKRIKECWKSMPDIGMWRDAINQIPKERDKRGNKFYLGENERNWKANFDWFINTNMPCVDMYEKSQIIEPVKEEKGGFQKLADGVDNEKASAFIGDILKGIR
jgi:hypothetical protein